MAYWKDYLIWSNFNTDLQVIHPWKLDSKSDTLGVFQRNPYYYKVDAAGNQLPYVDTIRVPLMGMGDDAYLLQGLAGEIDFGLHHDFGGIRNFSVLRKAEQEGNFRLHAAMSAIIYNGTVYFNFAQRGSGTARVVQRHRLPACHCPGDRRTGNQRPAVPRSVHAVADAGGG